MIGNDADHQEVPVTPHENASPAPRFRGAPEPATVSELDTTAQSEQESVGDLVREASIQLSTLVRSEIELAKTELTASAKRAGISGALFGGAGAVVLFSLTFGLIALAEGLHAVGLYRWLAYLTVWGFLLLLAGAAALVGRLLIKRVNKPERTITTVKETAAWARALRKPEGPDTGS